MIRLSVFVFEKKIPIVSKEIDSTYIYARICFEQCDRVEYTYN